MLIKKHRTISLLTTVLTTMFCCAITQAQTHTQPTEHWRNLGDTGFSAGPVSSTSIAVDAFGTPYVVYVDQANYSSITVMKFDGTNWINVGNAGFSAGQVDYTSIVIDSSGTPYVVYQDQANGFKATVMKFNDTNWVNVGIPGFSAGAADEPKIALTAAGTPYVAYTDLDHSDSSGRITVMKFNDTSWVNVGNAKFSKGIGAYPDIAISTSGTPYVVFSDFSSAVRATVMKFDGNDWVTLGNAGFSENEAFYSSIAIDANETPFVSFSFLLEGSPSAQLMKFSDTGWVNVGTAFSSDDDTRQNFVINAAGIPYVVYKNDSVNGKATVIKLNDNHWETVDTVGFPSDAAYFTNLNIATDNTGNIYVVYSDTTNDSKASVMTIAPDSVLVPDSAVHVGINELVQNVQNKMFISPVPATDVLNVQLNNSSTGKAAISIYDLAGKEILTNNFILEKNNQIISFSLNGIASGAYFVRATINEQPLPAQKLIKN